MNKISVITPAFRVEKCLERCVNSILQQTYRNFELLLTDDGSDDKSGEICDEYALTDERTVVFHQENRGVSSARNLGIDYALNISISEWISFIDSDDWLRKEYFEKLYKACIENNVNVSMCGAENEYNDGSCDIGNVNCNINSGMINALSLFEIENPFPFVAPHDPWGKLIKKDFVIDLRFPVGRFGEDRALMYKILMKTEKIYFVAEPLYRYYINNEGLTRARWSPKCIGVCDTCDEQIEFFRNKNKEKARLHMEQDLIDSIFLNMWEIRNLGTGEYKKEYKTLQKRLKMALDKYEQELNIPKDSKYYYYACPLKMKVWSKWQVVSKKIRCFMRRT